MLLFARNIALGSIIGAAIGYVLSKGALKIQTALDRRRHKRNLSYI
jgi:membrane protein YqaA with SNARE-associated domain